MLFVVHVDYIIIPELHHMTIDDSFRSPRTPRRRRQGQSWPDDAGRERPRRWRRRSRIYCKNAARRRISHFKQSDSETKLLFVI